MVVLIRHKIWRAAVFILIFSTIIFSTNSTQPPHLSATTTNYYYYYNSTTQPTPANSSSTHNHVPDSPPRTFSPSQTLTQYGITSAEIVSINGVDVSTCFNQDGLLLGLLAQLLLSPTQVFYYNRREVCEFTPVLTLHNLVGTIIELLIGSALQPSFLPEELLPADYFPAPTTNPLNSTSYQTSNAPTVETFNQTTLHSLSRPTTNPHSQINPLATTNQQYTLRTIAQGEKLTFKIMATTPLLSTIISSSNRQITLWTIDFQLVFHIDPENNPPYQFSLPSWSGFPEYPILAGQLAQFDVVVPPMQYTGPVSFLFRIVPLTWIDHSQMQTNQVSDHHSSKSLFNSTQPSPNATKHSAPSQQANNISIQSIQSIQSPNSSSNPSNFQPLQAFDSLLGYNDRTATYILQGFCASREYPCQNGGTCNHAKNRCECLPGFDGALCQIKLCDKKCVSVYQFNTIQQCQINSGPSLAAYNDARQASTLLPTQLDLNDYSISPLVTCQCMTNTSGNAQFFGPRCQFASQCSTYDASAASFESPKLCNNSGYMAWDLIADACSPNQCSCSYPFITDPSDPTQCQSCPMKCTENGTPRCAAISPNDTPIVQTCGCKPRTAYSGPSCHCKMIYTVFNIRFESFLKSGEFWLKFQPIINDRSIVIDQPTLDWIHNTLLPNFTKDLGHDPNYKLLEVAEVTWDRRWKTLRLVLGLKSKSCRALHADRDFIDTTDFVRPETITFDDDILDARTMWDEVSDKIFFRQATGLWFSIVDAIRLRTAEDGDGDDDDDGVFSVFSSDTTATITPPPSNSKNRPKQHNFQPLQENSLANLQILTVEQMLRLATYIMGSHNLEYTMFDPECIINAEPSPFTIANASHTTTDDNMIVTSKSTPLSSSSSTRPKPHKQLSSRLFHITQTTPTTPTPQTQLFCLIHQVRGDLSTLFIARSQGEPPGSDPIAPPVVNGSGNPPVTGFPQINPARTKTNAQDGDEDKFDMILVIIPIVSVLGAAVVAGIIIACVYCFGCCCFAAAGDGNEQNQLSCQNCETMATRCYDCKNCDASKGDFCHEHVNCVSSNPESAHRKAQSKPKTNPDNTDHPHIEIQPIISTPPPPFKHRQKSEKSTPAHSPSSIELSQISSMHSTRPHTPLNVHHQVNPDIASNITPPHFNSEKVPKIKPEILITIPPHLRHPYYRGQQEEADGDEDAVEVHQYETSTRHAPRSGPLELPHTYYKNRRRGSARLNGNAKEPVEPSQEHNNLGEFDHNSTSTQHHHVVLPPSDDDSRQRKAGDARDESPLSSKICQIGRISSSDDLSHRNGSIHNSYRMSFYQNSTQDTTSNQLPIPYSLQIAPYNNFSHRTGSAHVSNQSSHTTSQDSFLPPSSSNTPFSGSQTSVEVDDKQLSHALPCPNPIHSANVPIRSSAGVIGLKLTSGPPPLPSKPRTVDYPCGDQARTRAADNSPHTEIAWRPHFDENIICFESSVNSHSTVLHKTSGDRIRQSNRKPSLSRSQSRDSLHKSQTARISPSQQGTQLTCDDHIAVQHGKHKERGGNANTRSRSHSPSRSISRSSHSSNSNSQAMREFAMQNIYINDEVEIGNGPQFTVTQPMQPYLSLATHNTADNATNSRNNYNNQNNLNSSTSLESPPQFIPPTAQIRPQTVSPPSFTFTPINQPRMSDVNTASSSFQNHQPLHPSLSSSPHQPTVTRKNPTPELNSTLRHHSQPDSQSYNLFSQLNTTSSTAPNSATCSSVLNSDNSTGSLSTANSTSTPHYPQPSPPSPPSPPPPPPYNNRLMDPNEITPFGTPTSFANPGGHNNFSAESFHNQNQSNINHNQYHYSNFSLNSNPGLNTFADNIAGGSLHRQQPTQNQYANLGLQSASNYTTNSPQQFQQLYPDSQDPQHFYPQPPPKESPSSPYSARSSAHLRVQQQTTNNHNNHQSAFRSPMPVETMPRSILFVTDDYNQDHHDNSTQSTQYR